MPVPETYPSKVTKQNIVDIAVQSNSNAAALPGLQPLDADLTAIAVLSTTAYGRAFLALVDAAGGRTALGLGTAATTAATAYEVAGAAATAQAAAIQRANHTGTQAAATVTGLATVATSGLKADVGLANVDNTSDANKPVSTAQQNAIDVVVSPISPRRIGAWYSVTQAEMSLSQTLPISTVAEWHMGLLLVRSPITVDALGISVTAAGTGGLIRLGIYAVTSLPTVAAQTTGLNTSLIVDAGQISTGTAGAKVATFTPVVIPAGMLIGLVAVVQAAGAGLACRAGTSITSQLLGKEAPDAAFGTEVGLRKLGSSVTAALPASLDQATSFSTQSFTMMRRSA